ncbi:MAG: chromate transporter [Gallionellales bacterium 35-53-114]|jgi:chromate transporter|nr:MAG: chromate transporter [Gallionellales bacterium 35-53-114]OYZ62689.1 MAG: chromate transporter [Gallionellales bacterium 24-53-125]OZB09764.1 MAG: chromate transporter [Gallionellales bacterium 39-52-133]HQS57673.1 chromate efflux transporter [Gallionellaceae bacterium]HQS74127.1 chromate efflux transporter [Gallionellaceae bacterium]
MSNEAIPTTPPPPVTFWEAFRYWFKLGFISFGGPAGQIAMMHQELVEKRRWISEHRYLHGLNFCMLLPGPEAIQLAIYISWLMHGIKGAVVAGVMFFLPAFILLSLMAGVYLAWGDVPMVQGIFYGIKPAVVAVVLFAAWRIGSRALKNEVLWAMAALAFIGIFFFDIGFPWIVLAAAILGALGGKFLPAKFKSGGGHGTSHKQHGPALIDDDTPTPAHAKFSWGKLIATTAAFIAIWLAAMFAISGQQTLTDMGEFFTKAAFLTIGGAYAVLPYVYQGGVEEFAWLSGPQMMDGLALGETTPGPLIMIVTWVGYMGGVAKEVFSNPIAAGLAGAAAATFFTFLPSFFFIIAGGPLVESTRGEIKFTAPLTAITAAVVGVIINLAAFFAWHTFWPQGVKGDPFVGAFDWLSVVVAIAAFIALWKYKADIMKVIGICALLGLAYSFTRPLLGN